MSLLSTCTDRLRCLLLVVLCMTGGSALAQSIEKAIMPGEVIEGHRKYEHECNQCHLRFKKSEQSKLCLDCHKDVARDIREKRKFHGKMTEQACRVCHTEHKGRKAKIAVIDKETFDHGKTAYRLNGAHQEIRKKCDSCHRSGVKYRETPQRCNDCHLKDDEEKGHKGALGKKCESCHDEKRWADTSFDHEKTKFSLLGGKHADVKCKGCHADKTYQRTPLTCQGCHKKDDQEKGHKGRLGPKCETCHNDKSWKESSFNHDEDTHYALKGKHRQTKCNACHQPEKGEVSKVKWPTKCIACHKKDDDDKGHRGNLGDKCESCHNERGWKNSSFDHDETKFSLRDQHKEAKCEDCHKGGVSGAGTKKLKIDTACLSCHKKQEDERGHRGRYGERCESCHGVKSWVLGKYDHDKETKYALKGGHRTVKCDSCHLPDKGILAKTKWETACIACHKKDDKHKGQLGQKCESCHDEKGWRGKPFDHDKARFALTGGHAIVECKSCHITPAFRDAPVTCIGCHDKDDKHKRRFGTKCASCHLTTSWKSWDYDHATTHFPLDGGHKKLACDDCHKISPAGVVKTSRMCGSCHQKDDVHDGGFGVQCDRCHVTTNWRKVRR